jgi:cytochrome P450
MDALPAARLAAWQQQIEPVAKELLRSVQPGRTVDVLRVFAMPLCLRLATLVLDAPAELHERLSALGDEVFAGTGAPDDSPLRSRAAAATTQLERLLAKSPMPMPEPAFVATSQTTPRLLASIWLALYEHPAEIARLRRCPDLWPVAVDEMLRYAGIVRRIWRQARSAVQIGTAAIREGQRVMLMLASANRDPEQFDQPDRLNLARRSPGQLALGAGRNSCAGAALVRMAVTIATRELIEQFPDAVVGETPQWRAGSGYSFPESVPMTLHCGNKAAVFT